MITLQVLLVSPVFPSCSLGSVYPNITPGSGPQSHPFDSDPVSNCNISCLRIPQVLSWAITPQVSISTPHVTSIENCVLESSGPILRSIFHDLLRTLNVSLVLRFFYRNPDWISSPDAVYWVGTLAEVATIIAHTDSFKIPPALWSVTETPSLYLVCTKVIDSSPPVRHRTL